MNMSKSIRIIFFAATASVAAACTSGARIDGAVESAPSSEVVVKLLDANRYSVLDTVKTDASGKFSYKVDVKKGQPEFVYLFFGDRRIASLLLENGDKVKVSADTLGNYAVEGSEESSRLAKVEKDYSAASARLSDLAARLEAASGEAETMELKSEMGREYVAYYRECVKYVLQNSRSLTVVPVLYQSFGESLPVFGQKTDAIHFTNAADSLETVYPDSRYVKALRAEAQRRFGYLELETRLNGAAEIGFPDIELPDLSARKIRLSDVDSKVVMVYFWSASDAKQNIFNTDVLKPLYGKYHQQGFEVYQVSLDPDKTMWATAVKNQELPWINVCDSRADASPYVSLYNLSSLPMVFFIREGMLSDEKVRDGKDLEKVVAKLLK